MTPIFWQYLLAAEMPAQKSRAILRELGGSRLDPVAFLLAHPSLSDAERRRLDKVNPRQLEKVMSQGVQLLPFPTYQDVDSEEFPPALFVAGDIRALNQPSIGIVGTRSASTYGKALAMKFAEALAKAGLVVVSGGALGIDGSAHEGALDANGQTVAVLGCGIDRVYPQMHAALFDRIKNSGCLVSQFAVGTGPESYNFIARNPIIAALSTALLVIEMPEKSGALRTVAAAVEQGKNVFVVPGDIGRTGFRGSHALVRDGATLVDHPDQVLEAMGYSVESIGAPQGPQLSEVQQKIIEALDEASLSPEAIGMKTGVDPAIILSELTILELDGFVMRDGHSYALRP